MPALAQVPVFGDAASQRVAMTSAQQTYLDALHGYVGTPRVHTADVSALDAEQEVMFALADGVALALAPDRVERYEDGAFSWFGTVRGADGVEGQAVVSVRDGRMIGDFSTPDASYALKPLGGSLHALVQLGDEMVFESEEDAARLPRGESPWAEAEPIGAETKRSGTPTYRVLFPFTPPAVDVVPDIALVAQQSIAFANQSYANSQINLRAEFAGLYRLNMPETNSLETDLRRLQNMTDGFGDDIHAERNRVGADVVTLFRTADETPTAGVAFVCAGRTSAFGTFEIDGSGTGVVFTHEVGHILGGGHEDAASTTPRGGCDVFSQAKERANGQWRTIMFSSFSNQTTIPYFSNPSVSVDGVATGNAGTSDNARTLRSRASTVANFLTGAGSSAVAAVEKRIPRIEVLVGEVTDDTYGSLFIRNDGGSDLRWWGLTSASPDFTFHTLGELVLDDLDDSGRVLTLEKGSCASGTDLTEGFASFDFGFDFPFNGEVYTEARASASGYVVFDGYDGCSADVPDQLPAAGGPESFISAFWSPGIRPVRSQSGAETRVITETLDDGRFSVKWIDAGFLIPALDGSFFFVSAQAVFGPDGSVEFRYGDLFRTLVGNTDFDIDDGNGGTVTIDVPLTREVRVGIEYAGDDGTEVPFGRLQSAGQVFFPNPALQLLEASKLVVPAQVSLVPLRIDATKLPLGSWTLPLTLISDAPNAPLLEIDLEVDVVTVLSDGDDEVAALTVDPVRPNPAADAATLAFTLATPARVEVSVFDALGRAVQRLDLGAQAAGRVEAALETASLAPGVYVVRLDAGGEMRTRRLTVVR